MLICNKYFYGNFVYLKLIKKIYYFVLQDINLSFIISDKLSNNL